MVAGKIPSADNIIPTLIEPPPSKSTTVSVVPEIVILPLA